MKTLTRTLEAVGSYPQPVVKQAVLLQQDYVGKQKWQIEQALREQHCQFVQFAHWLYVVESGLILSFCHQICVQVGSC